MEERVVLQLEQTLQQCDRFLARVDWEDETRETPLLDQLKRIRQETWNDLQELRQRLEMK